MFASGKTVYFTGLLSVVDFIKLHPDLVSRALDTGDFSAIPDLEFKDKLDWLFAHFDHDLDRDEWASTLTTPPSLTAYKKLLLSHPEWLKTALQKAIAADVTIAPSDIKLSAPHEAYLRLHAARLGLNDTQTDWLISQQKQATAAKAIDDLAAQGITTPDKTQIQKKLQEQSEWVNSHTASLQREVLRHDTRITDQLHQSFHHVINSQPTTIPQSEITSASRELANLSYQTLKPYISKVSSAADLVNVLRDDILTPDRIGRIPTLAAYKIPPDLFHQALEAAAPNLYRRIKSAQQANDLLTNYGKYDYHNVSSATPPPANHLNYSARADFLTHGYPGESLLNALDPHAAENIISSIPHKLWGLATSPVHLVFGEVQTSLYSAYFTNHREQVQLWAINKSFSILDPQLQNQWQNLFNQAHAAHKPVYQLPQFDLLMENTQTWIRTQVQALHEGRLTLNFDTREKLLEANNNLNLLQLAHAHRQLLEKIPLVKSYYGLINRLSAKFPPIYLNYLQSWAQLAFRSGDPLQASFLLVEYAAVRPAIATLWRTAIVPWSRHLPFGWDVKQGTYGQEVYWKPAKWAKDNLKQGLGWLAEKTGARRIAEAISQKIFKATFAKLAATFSGVFLGISLGWDFFKKSIKVTAGLIFLFLITKGPWYAAWAVGGATAGAITGAIIGAKIGAAAGAIICFGLPICIAIGAGAGAFIGAGIGALLGGGGGLLIAWALEGLASWLTTLPAWASQLLPALSTIAFPTLAPWLVPAITGGLLFYQIYQKIQLQTAMIAPTISGLTGYPGTLPGGIIIPGPGGPYPTCWPSEGRITQGPGCDLSLPGGGSHCTGFDTNSVDIAGFTGQPIYATHDGTATAHTDLDSCYGNYVTITSPLGFTSYYAHLQQASFTGTIDVTAGTIIGYEDASTAPGCFDDPISGFGPHLHYELRGLDLALPYIPHLAAAGLLTTGCFASQVGGSSVTPQLPPSAPPPSAPSTTFPTSCQTFGGTCVSSGQCPVSGCGIARPVGGWTDCQTPAACCDTTGIVSSQCATSNSP